MDSELSLIERDQARLRADIERLDGWGRENPHRFAGLWFQNHDSSGREHVVIVVAVVDDLDGTTNELCGLVEHPDRLRVQRGRHTNAELLVVRDRVMHDLMPSVLTDTTGTHVTSLGIDSQEGRVVIGLNRVDREFADGLVAQFGSDWVRVMDEPQNIGPL